MRIETRQVTVSDDEHGQRLDAYLARRFPVLSRSEWQQRIAGGHVLLNQLKPRSSRKLNAGDQVEFSFTMRAEPEVDTAIENIFEDDYYLAVNKPPGLPVHPSGIYKTRTVATLLVERGLLAEPYILHRLDRETSGVLILAKTRAAAAAFQKILRGGGIEKKYLVAVEGKFASPQDAAGYIFRLPDSPLPRQRFYSPAPPPATALEVQTCRTLLKPIRFAPGLTLIEATLLTGRMHQIRATVHSLGYPVVGDKLYGVDPQIYFRFADDEMTGSDWQKLRIARSALHCSRMSLVHPLSRARWALNAPLPADMAGLFPG